MIKFSKHLNKEEWQRGLVDLGTQMSNWRVEAHSNGDVHLIFPNYPFDTTEAWDQFLKQYFGIDILGKDVTREMRERNIVHCLECGHFFEPKRAICTDLEVEQAKCNNCGRWKTMAKVAPWKA